MKINELVQIRKKKGHGEFAGPCAFCGGDDRFITWPEAGKTGRYWCRACKRSGDGIELLRELQGLTFLQAVEAWGFKPEDFPRTGRPKEKRVWTPKVKNGVPAEWSKMAEIFLEESEYHLLGNPKIREWLQGRGLRFETIRAARLGWNPKDEFHTRTLWGLDPATDQGKPIRTYLKAGLIIPHLKDGKVIGLKIRKANPDAGGKYTHVAGSASVPMVWGLDKKTLVIVEAELDGLLIHQEAGDIAGAVALGSAQARPDAETDRALKAADLLLIALDSDPAGARESWKWWGKQYPNARRWPVPNAKDPGDGWKAGLNLRSWLKAGLPDPDTSTTSTPESTTTAEPVQEQTTAHQEPPGATNTPSEGQDQGEPSTIQYRPFPESWRGLDEDTRERLAIATVCGGLTDEEAQRRILH